MATLISKSQLHSYLFDRFSVRAAITLKAILFVLMCVYIANKYLKKLFAAKNLILTVVES